MTPKPDPNRSPPASPIALANALRQRLHDDVLQALFLKIGTSDATRCVASSGVDVAIVDLEHSQMAYGDAGEVCVQVAAAGATPVVRVPQVDAGAINRLLEAGASGIQLSMTTTVAQVRSLVAATSYPPRGARSLSLSHRQARYGGIGRDEYLAASAPGPLLVVQIETAETADPLTEIVGAGADLVFIGTEDLDVSCRAIGVDPQARFAQIVDAAEQQGVQWGCFATAADVVERVRQGAALVATAADLGLLRAAVDDHVASVADQIASCRGQPEPTLR